MQAGITGVLRYDGAYFLQVLEGPREAVEATMARIRRDPRHTDIRILHAGPLEQRDFGAWHMMLVTEEQMARARKRDPDLLEVYPSAWRRWCIRRARCWMGRRGARRCPSTRIDPGHTRGGAPGRWPVWRRGAQSAMQSGAGAGLAQR